MDRRCLIFLAVLTASLSPAPAGPYSGPAGGPAGAPDAAIAGFVGPDGDGWNTPNNWINPVFVGWATGYLDYLPTSGVAPVWRTPERALGAVTGDHYNSIVSLGDLTADEIAQNLPPGRITLTFAAPIYNGPGADFAVFENAFCVEGIEQIMAELAYVEVSTNGLDFARFPCRSLTPQPEPDDWAYAQIDATDVRNLAGKHVNADGLSWGTPFDLADLLADPLVATGKVDLDEIRYVRLIDIPGSGDFLDSAGEPIYDAWWTRGSGGFDLEAVGVINQLLLGDASRDRLVDLDDLIRLCNHWGLAAGWSGGDFNGDGTVNDVDLAILAGNWGRDAAGPGEWAVPEPSAAALMAVALAALLRRGPGRRPRTARLDRMNPRRPLESSCQEPSP